MQAELQKKKMITQHIVMQGVKTVESMKPGQRECGLHVCVCFCGGMGVKVGLSIFVHSHESIGHVQLLDVSDERLCVGWGGGSSSDLSAPFTSWQCGERVELYGLEERWTDI